ncbi:MAG: hypothetical protein HXY30_11500 [Pseudorhodoplanes sp.]|nr:hypothetical protein [Pseudorhodoplanes sp.]
MAEDIDLSFPGEQIEWPQGDVCQVKSDMAQMRADNLKVEGDVAALHASLTRIEGKPGAFRESVDDRFDRQAELPKPGFQILSEEIQSIKNQ